MKGDIERHVQVARDAQQNYEREVMAHSGSLQSLTKAKEDLISLRNQLVESQVLILVFRPISHSYILHSKNISFLFEAMILL